MKISWTSDRCQTQVVYPPHHQTSRLLQQVQPTTTATFHSISSSSSTFTASQAMTNPSFGSFRLWEIVSLTLGGILFCFVALGCHFVRKKRSNNNNMSHAEEEEGTGGYLDIITLVVSAPAEEKGVTKEEGNGRLSWQSPFQPGGDTLDQNQVSAPAAKEEVIKEKENRWLSWQSPFSEVSAPAEEEAEPEEEGDGWLSRQR
eukprot:scaffold24737_cov80-Skeletonema_marinoi.AAC.2